MVDTEYGKNEVAETMLAGYMSDLMISPDKLREYVVNKNTLHGTL